MQGLAAGVAFEEEREGLFEITSRGIAIKTVRDKGLFAALSLRRLDDSDYLFAGVGGSLRIPNIRFPEIK